MVDKQTNPAAAMRAAIFIGVLPQPPRQRQGAFLDR
jgi:hypothetical protein